MKPFDGTIAPYCTINDARDAVDDVEAFQYADEKTYFYVSTFYPHEVGVH